MSATVCSRCGKSNRLGASFCNYCGAALVTRLQIGQVLYGKYTIIRLLGRGGMGAVYLASQTIARAQRQVVIKEMLDYYDPSDPQEEAKARQRFEAEASTLVTLNRAEIRIPQIFDFFTEGGRNYIVMDYIEGKNLEEGLTHEDADGKEIKGQPYGAEEVERWGIQVCQVLKHLAQKNVVHLDIKPANLILDRNGDIWLVDFGTAKAQQAMQTTGQVGMQQTSVFGTAGYAPPEQYKGQVEPRADVYALAATLYHLLTDDDPRTHPFLFPKLDKLPRHLAYALRQATEQDVSQRLTAAEFGRLLASEQKGGRQNLSLILLVVLTLTIIGLWFTVDRMATIRAERTAIAVAQETGTAMAQAQATAIISAQQTKTAITQAEKITPVIAQRTATAIARATATASARQTSTAAAMAGQTATVIGQATATTYAQQTSTAAAAKITTPIARQTATALARAEAIATTSAQQTSTAVTQAARAATSTATSLLITWVSTNTIWLALILIAVAAVVSVVSRHIIVTTIYGIIDIIQHRFASWASSSSTTASTTTIPPPIAPPPGPSSSIPPEPPPPPDGIPPRDPTNWMKQEKLIEDLFVQIGYEQLKSFLVHAKGRRFILTGYGRFGGTSLVRGAMEKARQELWQEEQKQKRSLTEPTTIEEVGQKAPEKEGALLVFYFEVVESSDQLWEYEIRANEFSLGTLSARSKEHLETLKRYTDSTKESSSTLYSLHFQLTEPLNESFLKKLGLPSIRGDYNFVELVQGLKNFFEPQKKSAADLQKIVRQTIGSEVLPSRVVIVLDRISRLETLEVLAHSGLFTNEHITMIAIARQEEFDQWKNCEQRLEAIQFEPWYIPCLWRREKEEPKPDYIQQVIKALLDPSGIQNVEAEKNFVLLRRHLAFVGRGALGYVLRELKNPTYYAERHGRYCLCLNSLPDPGTIKHNVWLQEVLDKNWQVILDNRFDGEQEEDRARIGVYHLLDWIVKERQFKVADLLDAAQNRKITICDNPHDTSEVTLNLLHVLEDRGYLQLSAGTKYERGQKRREPRRVKRRRQPVPPEAYQPTSAEEEPPERQEAPPDTEEEVHSRNIVFVGYSHQDEDAKNELEKHLGVLASIDLWSDDRIGAGADWEEEIYKAIGEAKVAILLVSANFLNSKFILQKEVPKLLKRRDEEGLVIFPVIATACAWRRVDWLEKMNVRPKNGEPVWSDAGKHVNEDLSAIAEEVADIVSSR